MRLATRLLSGCLLRSYGMAVTHGGWEERVGDDSESFLRSTGETSTSVNRMKVMKRIHRSIFLWAALLLPVFSAFAGTGEGVRAWMATDATQVQSGKHCVVTIALDLQPVWHTYWQYPGDSGLPPKVTWHLPEGWTAGPLEFSIPYQSSEPGDMIIYGYEKQQLLRAVITPPKNLPQNQVYDLKATLNWLACQELCVPGSAEVSVTVPGPAVDFNWKSIPVPKGAWPESANPPFDVSISGHGTNKVISFTGEIGATYELFPDPGFPPVGDTTVGHVSGMERGGIWMFTTPWDGPAPFKALLVEKIGEDRRAWWLGGEIAKASAPSSKATSSSPHGLAAGVLLAALFSGFLGGMILNLMPCVLPVISLKIFGFISQAGESPAKILRHGLAFAAGIFLWFLGLGVLVIVLKASGAQVTWGAFQFQNPLFVIFLSVVVFLFALNLFGVFEITLPGAAGSSLDHAASRGGYSGSFFQGLFATLLATPCTAPFLGSALGFAFGQSAVVIMAMFASVAFGMALPYLLLSARPGWRRYIPKPGIWMERLKQFMGFPLLATNLWLLWVLQNQRGSDAVLAMLAVLLLCGLLAWIVGILTPMKPGTFRSTILLLVVIGEVIALSILILHITRSSPPALMPSEQDGITWVPYSPDALQKLRDEGKPVLLDFTASWCLTCQFNERTAINVPTVRKLLAERGVIAMKGDWTNSDPAITAALKSFGRVGVPLAVFYPAGKGSDPVVMPELLSESIVLKTLAR